MARTISGTLLESIPILLFCVGIGSCCVGMVCCDENSINKEIRDAKSEVDEKVAQDIGAKSVDLTLLEVVTGESSQEYLLNLYGAADLADGTTLSLMSARYKMNYEVFINLLSACDGSYSKSLSDLDSISLGMHDYGRAEEERDKIVSFLNGVLTAIENSEYVGTTADGTIEAESDQKIVCSVSAPKNVDGKTVCDVVYIQADRQNGENGISAHLVKVAVDDVKNPVVIENIKDGFTPLDSFDKMLINEEMVESLKMREGTDFQKSQQKQQESGKSNQKQNTTITK